MKVSAGGQENVRDVIAMGMGAIVRIISKNEILQLMPKERTKI